MPNNTKKNTEERMVIAKREILQETTGKKKETRERPASAQELAILKTMSDETGKWWYGYELKKSLNNVEHPTIYNILLRLNETKLVESEWVGNPEKGERPRHRYKLNRKGISYAATELLNASEEKRKEVKELIGESS